MADRLATTRERAADGRPSTLSSILVDCAEIGLEGCPEKAIAEYGEEAVRILKDQAPPERTYGVCVGGAMLDPDRDEYTDPLVALRRAEEIRQELDAEGSDEPVQIVLWKEEAAAEDGILDLFYSATTGYFVALEGEGDPEPRRVSPYFADREAALAALDEKRKDYGGGAAA